jgi:calcineurin-like phosphoesterase
VRKEEPIHKFLTHLPAKFEVAKKDMRINAVVLTIDEVSGLALGIERVNLACG